MVRFANGIVPSWMTNSDKFSNPSCFWMSDQLCWVKGICHFNISHSRLGAHYHSWHGSSPLYMVKAGDFVEVSILDVGCKVAHYYPFNVWPCLERAAPKLCNGNQTLVGIMVCDQDVVGSSNSTKPKMATNFPFGSNVSKSLPMLLMNRRVSNILFKTS